MSIRLSSVQFTQNNIIQGVQTLSSVNTSGDLTVSTNKFVVTATTGNTQTAGTLSVGGATTLIGNVGVSGDFRVSTDKFIVNALTGDVTVGGGLSVLGGFVLSSVSVATVSTNVVYTNNIVLDTNKFIVSATTGNTQVAGTLSVGGATTLIGNVGISGNLRISTDNFIVTAATGNTTIAGTLSVGGAVTINGVLSANGGINVDSAKFTVDGANTGNIATQGTLQFLSSNGSGYSAFRMDCGQYTGGGTTGTYTIPFTQRFPSVPYVVATPLSDTATARVVWIRTVTLSNFTAQVENTAGATVNDAYINWIAFG